MRYVSPQPLEHAHPQGKQAAQPASVSRTGQLAGSCGKRVFFECDLRGGLVDGLTRKRKKRGENRSDRKRSWSLSTANGEDNVLAPFSYSIRKAIPVALFFLVVISAFFYATGLEAATKKSTKKTNEKKKTSKVTTSKPNKKAAATRKATASNNSSSRRKKAAPRQIRTSTPRRPAAKQTKPRGPSRHPRPQLGDGSTEPNSLPRPKQRARSDPPLAPQPEEQEQLPRPRRRVKDDGDSNQEHHDPPPDPERRRERNPDTKKKYKPPPGDRHPKEDGRPIRPRFDYEPEVNVRGHAEYEMCSACGYYACRCDYPYYEFHWGSYYLYEPDPYAHFEPALNTTESLVFGFTTATIVLNGLLAINDSRNGPAAFAGFAFGTASLVMGVSDRTSYRRPAVILGATAILFAYLNLQSSQASDPFEDRLDAQSFTTSAPGMAINLSF